MRKYRRIIVSVLIGLMVMLITACSSGSGNDSVVVPYEPTESETDIINLFKGDGYYSIVKYQFTEDYKTVTIGYDRYEKGKLVDGDVEGTTDMIEEAKAGKAAVIIDNENVKLSVTDASGSSATEYDMNDKYVGEEGATVGWSPMSMEKKIENGKKVAIGAYYVNIDAEKEMSVVAPEDLELSTMDAYDECYIYYIKFSTESKE